MEAVEFEDLPVLTGHVQVRRNGDDRVLHLSGEIDDSVVAGHLADDAASIAPVDVIDASAVTFMSTSGAVFLTFCRRRSRAAGRAARVVQPSPAVRFVVALLGLNVEVYGTPNAARDGGQAST